MNNIHYFLMLASLSSLNIFGSHSPQSTIMQEYDIYTVIIRRSTKNNHINDITLQNPALKESFTKWFVPTPSYSGDITPALVAAMKKFERNLKKL